MTAPVIWGTPSAFRSPGRLAVAAALGAHLFSAAALAANFTVTNTNDGGAGTLRQAILDATAAGGTNRIEFAIPGAGVKRIAPLTDLPQLPSGVTVDGFSQPGSSPNSLPTGSDAVLLIEIHGPGGGGDGLSARGSATLRGLVVNGWNGSSHAAGIDILPG